jgi:hypothetical protein
MVDAELGNADGLNDRSLVVVAISIQLASDNRASICRSSMQQLEQSSSGVEAHEDR